MIETKLCGDGCGRTISAKKPWCGVCAGDRRRLRKRALYARQRLRANAQST